VDYCFAEFPPWTIHKALFVWDLLLMAGYRFNRDKEHDTISCSSSIIIHSTSSDSVCSDYSANTSGATLVGNETVIKDHADHSAEESARICILKSWSKGWYHRWQVLLKILGTGTSQQDTCTLSQSISMAISTSLSAESIRDGDGSTIVEDVMDLLDQMAVSQRAKDADDGDEDEGEEAVTPEETIDVKGDDWSESESEEDYGVLLSKPSFGAVAENFLRSWNIQT
jgi:hypothetical protein